MTLEDMEIEVSPVLPDPRSPPPAPRRETLRNLAAFWLLGLLNNSAYVIMIAGAEEISAASVGLVYFCAIVPALLVKLSAPYWFHRVRYNSRVMAVAVLMAASYTTVAATDVRAWQLLGVTFSSFQVRQASNECSRQAIHARPRVAG